MYASALCAFGLNCDTMGRPLPYGVVRNRASVLSELPPITIMENASETKVSPQSFTDVRMAVIESSETLQGTHNFHPTADFRAKKKFSQKIVVYCF